MKKPILLLLALMFLCAPFAVAQEDFKPVTVFLVRHAEKEDEPRQDPPLKKEGVARSQELAKLLGAAGIKTIITSQFARTKQTAEPLATKLNLTPPSTGRRLSPASESSHP